MPPLVSVVVPVHNGELYLREALDSIFSQTHDPLEVLVVDDHSTDRSSEIIRSYGDRLRSFRNTEASGPARARNLALKESRGEWIAFLDADDIWPQGKLERHLAPLADPTIDIVWSKSRHFREERGERHFLTPPFHMIQLGSFVIRRSVLTRIGYMDESLIYSEDTDWLMRFLESPLKLEKIEDELLWYRIHPGGLSHKRDPEHPPMLAALKKAIDRKRQPGI